MPSGPRLLMDATRPRAGELIFVPAFAAMSIPAWRWGRPVNGEIRTPKREVSQPFAGQMEGIEASWFRLFELGSQHIRASTSGRSKAN